VTIETPFRWAQGEHISVIAQTGLGKSTLMAHLVKARGYVVVLRSKADDVTWDVDRKVRTADALWDTRYTRLELAPSYAERPAAFHDAFELSYRHGGWTVVADDLIVLSRMHITLDKRRYPLTADIERHLMEGRSKKLSVVAGLQRPSARDLSRFQLSQSTHVIAGQMERRDAKLLAEATSDEMGEVVQGLRKYQFAWHRKPNQIWVGKLNVRTHVLEGHRV
jgi:hypothetical protein